MDLREKDEDWKPQIAFVRGSWVVYVKKEWNEKLKMKVEKLRGARVITNSFIFLIYKLGQPKLETSLV